MHVVAVGGSDAGISAALRARELDPSSDVTVVVADTYPNFSICGIPYYISGEVTHWRTLAHRTHADLEAITGDGTSGRLLGAQLVGAHGSETAKRVDTYATALFNGLAVQQIGDLDLSYTPPFGAPWDAVQTAAHAWTRHHEVKARRPAPPGQDVA
jgi:hypothetical protein